MSTRIRYRVRICGKVQGVFFRAETLRKAQSLGLVGWVRNLKDGSVEALIEGEDEAVRAMLAWCWKGSPFSRVEEVTVSEEPYRNEFRDFQIMRTV